MGASHLPCKLPLTTLASPFSILDSLTVFPIGLWALVYLPSIGAALTDSIIVPSATLLKAQRGLRGSAPA